MGDLKLIRCLGRAGIPVILADSAGIPHYRRSRYVKAYHRLPGIKKDPGGVLSMLIEIARGIGCRPVLFCERESELKLIASHSEELAEHYHHFVPDGDLVLTSLDKVRFSRFCQERNWPIPRTWSLDRTTPLDAVAEEIEFPAVLKPAMRDAAYKAAFFGSRRPSKVIRLSAVPELIALRDAISRYDGDLLVQREIQGTERQIYSFHGYFDRTGKYVAGFCGRKVRTFPREFGVSSCLDLIDDPDLEALGVKLMSSIGYRGPVKLDFKKDVDTGEVALLEVNARCTLWNYLGLRIGVNLPEIAYNDILGRTTEVERSFRRTRYLWLSVDYRSFRQHREARQLTLLQWLRSIGAANCYHLWDPRDPGPFFARTWERTGHRVIRKLS
jgi:predicted ATP-grasp superfamily ATP-dependent carboligase